MEAITTLIKVILETKEKFKTDHVIDVLTGKESVSVKAYGHQELEILVSEMIR